MADVVLKHVEKIYPYVEKKKRSFKRSLKNQVEEKAKKSNLQLTEKGVLAVKDFNIEIKDGEFIVLVGPSGCGKSTTLRMIAGLEDITSGELYIDGKLCNAIEPKDRDIAMVFQSYALYPHMTVFDNIAYPLKFVKYKDPLPNKPDNVRHLTKKEIEKRVLEAAKLLEIEELLDRKPKHLSGGQRQRVAIGRAIVRNPKVLLMDEPLSNLDAKLRNQMRAEIINLREKIKTTFIYVTHDQIEAMTLGDRIVVMKDGIIQQIDTPQDVYEHPRNLFISGFIGSPRMNYFDAELLIQAGQYKVVLKNGYTVVPCEEKQARLRNNHVKGQRIILGVRPDHIAIKDEGIECKVRVSELMGASSHIHAEIIGNDYTLSKDASSNDIIAIIQNNGTYKNYVGSILKFGFNGNVVHMFSKETENNLEF
ncbi:MAG: ATP-binding cassette domain-containing protein [Bacilli bacterium]|jgi:multiple sugar transport system ATP-binding protein|nr:ATP-binding cassette domain-containing protein [Bacilli bacterium]HHU23944.1 ATP-binding cassette domain-containing protein [Acholeplasmataceae bacterium]